MSNKNKNEFIQKAKVELSDEELNAVAGGYTWSTDEILYLYNNLPSDLFTDVLNVVTNKDYYNQVMDFIKFTMVYDIGLFYDEKMEAIRDFLSSIV